MGAWDASWGTHFVAPCGSVWLIWEIPGLAVSLRGL